MTDSDTKKNREIFDAIRDHQRTIDLLQTNLTDIITKLAEKASETIRGGGKLCFIGNGGSAADCQHLAAEFIGRFRINRHPLPAIAFTTDTSIITAIGNDFGFESIFERQILALCGKADMVIIISTSGNSENIIRAVEACRVKEIFTAGLLGKDGGKLARLLDLSIVVPSEITARIQEAHILIGHIICEYCDENFSIHTSEP